MNTFKKKSLCTALVGAGMLGLAGAAQAVNVNPDGLGQVLIFPYYTVRATADGANFDSLLSIVNTTESAKAVKVRFLEGKNSKEVLDFNLYLSKMDVWTGAVIDNGSSAALFSQDKTCTRPPMPSTVATAEPFRTHAYAGKDAADQTLDRTREGYVEVIEMGSIYDDGTANNNNAQDAKTAGWVTHINGVPAGCGNITNTTGGQTDNDVTTPSGGLFGSLTLVNPKAGLDIATDPVALEGFSQTALWYPTGTMNPNLSEVNPQVSVVVDGLSTYVTNWATRYARKGAAAVSAVLMHDSVLNEYVVGGGAAAQTDWVITMPTKNQYFGTFNATAKATPVLELFQNNFVATGSCDELGLYQTDREEKMTENPDDWSPTPDLAAGPSICWESNVISFGANSKSLLASTNSYKIDTEGNQAGWAGVTFSAVDSPVYTLTGPTDAWSKAHKLTANAAAILATGSFPAQPAIVTNVVTVNPLTGAVAAAQATVDVVYTGLPMIGFAAQVFNNGALTVGDGKVNANYAGRLNHKMTRDIQ